MAKATQDKQLYKRLKKKDKEAFIEAYDSYLDDIYRFVFFKVSSQADAEDLSSYIFLKAWDYVQNNNLKDYKTLKALLYKIARNAIVDHYRKNSKTNNQSLDDGKIDIKDEKQDLVESLVNKDNVEFLLKKINELKDEYRDVLILRYVNELNVAEIANVIGKNKGNVRVIIYRATKALRDITEGNSIKN
ncbi:MAG: RNA polymerase sigma factor [Patescibacteria group bacterium]|nr:RNA polymerase sigma factor [Patescibacteria group bacterium]